MAATARLPALDHVTLPYVGSLDIEVGDLCIVAPVSPALTGLTAGNVYPAASIPDQGSAAANQRLFAKLFAGVSHERHLATDAAGTQDVVPIWVGDVSCAATAFKAGDLVGVAENGGNNGILSQQVAKVTDPNLAIGKCVKDTGGVSVTTVSVVLFSELFLAPTGNNFNLGGPTLTAAATAGAATLNAKQGTITSEALTTAAGADYTLTLTNSNIYADSIITVSLDNGTNTTAPIYVRLVTPAAGSATIVVRNAHASSALNGTIKVNFVVA